MTASSQLLERMVADRLISDSAQSSALSWVQRTGDRVEEALLEIDAVQETALLKYLATLYKTRFVSTEKLAKAEIDPAVLQRVPKKVAEKANVFPVLYDEASGALSVVTPDPVDLAVLDDVRATSGAREVRAFVSRPKAVRAAINKAYGGDIHAFAKLDKKAQKQLTEMLDYFERNVVSEESMAASLANEGSGRERVISPGELERSGNERDSSGGIADESYIETLNVLVSLLENARQDLRGHSSQVARLVRQIAERIGLGNAEKRAYIIAAHIHDLGKMGAYHLTALNVADYEGHRASAQKLFTAPSRLMEATQLPDEAIRSVEAMYERYDGGGMPNGMSGREIPLGARLVALADTYADLTQNPRNPFRKALSPPEACEVLERYKEKVFDPNLVDLFRHAMTGEDLKARLLSNRYRALIIDSDPEETTVLELRLVERGFEVKQACSSDQALKLLEAGDVDVVCSEIDLKPLDGFALLERARQASWGESLPWIFVTRRGAGSDAHRAFELGAADYMTKPLSSDLLVAKMKQLIERSAQARGPGRGVSGSLSEMGLPDMVQVLWHGRKTGSLKIRSKHGAGEIHFVQGNIYNALWRHARGEEAFYAMLGLEEGEFALDPHFQAPQQLIPDSPEMLLLEGMRRLDEASR